MLVDCVRVNLNRLPVQSHCHLSCSDIDGRMNIFVDGFWRHAETLTKNLELKVAAYESNEADTAMIGLGKGHWWGNGTVGKAERETGSGECTIWCSALEL